MKSHARFLAALVIVIAFCVPTFGQQTAYKWVDKDGNVHFSDEPPTPSEAVSIEEILLPESSVSQQTRPPPVSKSPTLLEDERAEPVASTSIESTPPVGTNFDSLSQEELDRRCEAEREEKIAPLREIEIEKCIHEQRKDADYCRRFFGDYGEGGRTVHGAFRPRMFNDLPVCLEAEKRRHGGQ